MWRYYIVFLVNRTSFREYNFERSVGQVRLTANKGKEASVQPPSNVKENARSVVGCTYLNTAAFTAFEGESELQISAT